MSEQYVGEIRYFPYLRGAPSGWLICDGSTPTIQQYQMLAALLGTTYGGDGSTTFGLPDLRGRVPIGAGAGTPIGQAQGSETVQLNTTHLPPHQHFIDASTQPANSNDPTGRVFATAASGTALYMVPDTPSPVGMANTMVGPTGQGLPHDNCAPTLPIVACIAWDGYWPQQNN